MSRSPTLPVRHESWPKKVVFLTTVAVVAWWLRWSIAIHGGFWRDEGLFLFVVKEPSWTSMLDFLRFHESHPPLFYALMRVWVSVFGDSDARSVVPSVALGIALVPGMFFAGQSLFNERVGTIATGLAALSPALTEYSAVARPYSAMPLLTLASIYLLIRALDGSGKGVWASYSICTSVLLYIHNWSWLVLIGEWAAVIVVILTSSSKDRGRFVRAWLVVQAIVGVTYLPWLSTLAYQVQHAGHPPSFFAITSDYQLAISVGVRRLLEATLLGYAPLQTHIADSALAVIFLMPLLFLIATEWIHLRSKNTQLSTNDESCGRRRIAFICLLVTPIAAWLAAVILSTRSEVLFGYCLVSLAPLVLLAASAFLGHAWSRITRVASYATIIVILMTYSVTLYMLISTTRANARELATAVAGSTRSSDVVLISPEWLASSFNRYYLPVVDQVDFPSLKREGAVDFGGFLDRLRDSTVAEKVFDYLSELRKQNRRVWLIVDRSPNVSRSAAPELLHSNNYRLVAIARTSQLRAKLDSLYGGSRTILHTSFTPRYEELSAVLYEPSGAR